MMTIEDCLKFVVRRLDVAKFRRKHDCFIVDCPIPRQRASHSPMCSADERGQHLSSCYPLVPHASVSDFQKSAGKHLKNPTGFPFAGPSILLFHRDKASRVIPISDGQRVEGVKLV